MLCWQAKKNTKGAQRSAACDFRAQESRKEGVDGVGVGKRAQWRTAENKRRAPGPLLSGQRERVSLSHCLPNTVQMAFVGVAGVIGVPPRGA